MRLTSHASLLIGLGYCLLAASRLNGQVGGSLPWDTSRPAPPKVGDYRSWCLEQPRIQHGDFAPRVMSPAQEVQNLMRGGVTSQPPVEFLPNPPAFDPKDILIPPTNIQIPPPKDHSGEIGAIFSIAIPLGILIAITAIGLAHRRQEKAAQGPKDESARTGPDSQGPLHRGRSFVKLGADGKGGIMHRGTNDFYLKGERHMNEPGQPVVNEQASRQGSACGGQRTAVMSLILGLLSIAMNVFPTGLLFLLQRWLGEFLPLFLPFSVGALAFGLAVLGLVRASRVSWLAIVGLVFGFIGMGFGSLIAIVTFYTWLRIG